MTITAQIDAWLADAARDRPEGERLLIEARLQLELMRTERDLRVPRHVYDDDIRTRDELIAAYRKRLGLPADRRRASA